MIVVTGVHGKGGRSSGPGRPSGVTACIAAFTRGGLRATHEKR